MNKNNPNANYAMYDADREAKRKAQPELPRVTGSGTAPREKWAMVEKDGRWLVGFDGGGRPIWNINRLRGGFFAPSEIDIEGVQFIEA